MKVPKKTGRTEHVLEVHSFKVGEKGFGTCEVCGKKTMGKSNDLCSRCGGASPASLVNAVPPDTTFEQDYVNQEGEVHTKRGFHAAQAISPDQYQKQKEKK